MKPTKKAKRTSGDAAARWAKVAYDVSGIDRDIETLVRLLQKLHGYTHPKANAELILKLTLAT